jgi:pimeloyl-ACP methyl ester carboxylesterase
MLGRGGEMSPLPETRYARCGELFIAWQESGKGPIDLVLVPGIVSHVEAFHELPGYEGFLERVGRFARVIAFDKRGTGLSDRATEAPTFEERMDDIRAVMDAAGCERAALFGISEGGSLAALFAASFPERSRALILFGSFPRVLAEPDSYPFGFPEGALGTKEQWLADWGTGTSAELMFPSRAREPSVRQLWARIERLAAAPSGFWSLAQVLQQIDVRAVLPTVRVPTLVLRPERELFPPEMSRYFAEHIPGARLIELPGVDHYPWLGPVDGLVAEVEEFLTGVRSHAEPDRVLATVLFVDIVGSTARAAELGDRRWRELLDAHDAGVRREVARARGRELGTAGDGFLAAFDGPARAIRCAQAIRAHARGLGLEVRAGLHTGECEVRGQGLAGIALHIGARVAALAGPGEVLVTSTVHDLVAGSGIAFAERGAHALAGVPGERRILAVA